MRSLASLTVLGAVAIVATAAWWIDVPSERGMAGESPAESSTTSAHRSVAHADDEPSFEAIDDGHQGLGSTDLYEYLNDPANSDLPAETFAQVTRLAADIVRADATGEGRERWPTYWSTESRTEPCCTSINVHAAGAYSDPGDLLGAVRVTVIWSSPSLGERTAEITLEKVGAFWEPAPWPAAPRGPAS